MEHQHERKLVGDGWRAGIVVEAFAENFDGGFELRGAGVGHAQIEALERRAYTATAGFVEQGDDRGVVSAIEEILGEGIESRCGVGVDGEGGAPFSLGFGGSS